jgi:hypothetical protein
MILIISQALEEIINDITVELVNIAEELMHFFSEGTKLLQCRVKYQCLVRKVNQLSRVNLFCQHARKPVLL